MDDNDPSQANNDMTLNGSGAATSARLSREPVAPNLEAILEIGTVLGGRYQILQMLGLGGMGAVYKAHDKELDRLIALKVIRPDIAKHPEALARFRQELLTARQVTHKNVVRIFDIGDADGLKFITMEYVSGKDLHSILAERGKLPLAETLLIVRQMCSALASAHAEGVVHRDLKPGNIMRDENGRIVVMDFGLARSLEDTNKMTQTGAMLGTVEYMSPEQALGDKLDARSDVFTMGLIFYELLTGNTPYKADTSLASLVKRTQERATALVDVDPTIPKPISDMVAKCLERDRGQRFQSAQEILDRIDEFEGKRAPKSIFVAAPPAKKKPWIPIAIAAAVVIALAVGVTLFLKMRGGPAQAQKPVTVLLADFANGTSEDVFDGTLEPAFALALEGAPFITAYNRAQARRELNQIKPGAALDETNGQLVAVRNGIGVVVTGSVGKQADGYTMMVLAIDAVSGKVITSQGLEAQEKSAVLKAVGTLAARIRTDLGDTTIDSAKLAAQETYTSASMEAAHEYAKAQELRYSGKTEEAIKGYLKATELDPKFGTAYAGLAAVYANLGRREEAKKAYQLAMQNENRMTEREKFRTRGGYYLATLDAPHAIEEFTALTKAFPADNMGHSALAFAYYLSRDMTKAIEQGRRALEIYPKNVPYRNNVALYALYASDFETAETEAATALTGNPSYLKAYLTLALAQIAQAKRTEAAETYRKLQQVSAAGKSFGASGLADLALYQGRNKEAIELLTASIADDLAAEKRDSAAKKLVMLAEAQFAEGNKSAAQASVDRALATSRPDVLFSAARMLVELGQYPKASALAGELGAKLEPVPQAQAKLVEAEISLKKGKNADAVQLLQASIGISDLWLARFALGRAYLASNAFPQAESEFERCVKRQGESSDVFLDEMPTFHYYPAVAYYSGMVRTAQGNVDGATAMYKSFLEMRSQATKDPLVTDAKNRIK